MPNQRIKAIHGAAVKLFLQQGYSKTQISHIAKAVGVSVGTIYHEFAGKREIMHFVLKCTLEPDFMDRDLKRPITDDLFDGLDKEIMAAFEANAQSFSVHLKNEEYQFEQLISDTFDLLAKYAVGCLFIEKNEFDFPQLAQYYREYRKRFFSVLIEYLEAFIKKGTIRPVKEVMLTARLMVELLSWWAMDRPYISFEPGEVSMDQAKAVCMDNLLSAYQRQ